MVRKIRAQKICSKTDCKNIATTASFCRLHYLEGWKNRKKERAQKKKKNLEKYIDYITDQGGGDNQTPDLSTVIEKSQQKKNYEHITDDVFQDVMDELDMGREVDLILSKMNVDHKF